MRALARSDSFFRSEIAFPEKDRILVGQSQGFIKEKFQYKKCLSINKLTVYCYSCYNFLVSFSASKLMQQVR